MTPGFSFYLNLLRFLAAFIVVLSHFAYERFTRGDYLYIRDWNLGSDAVIIFFVISGFVIAYTAREKDKGAARYTFARATRLYSVVVPAILATLLFDYLGAHIDPAAYDGWWWNPAPAWEVLLRTLSFSTEWGASGFRPGTNGPFWSLSYETGYYLLFGAALFLSGWSRIVVLALLLVLVGVKPLLLMPAWLLGVWLYHRGGATAHRPALALALFLVPLGAYVAALALHLPVQLLAASTALLGPDTIASFRFSNEFLWNGLLGILVAYHLTGAMHLSANTAPRPRIASAVSWLGGASFSIYLVHYPAMQFWSSVLPQTQVVQVRDILLLAITLLSCFLFAAAFERPLPLYRRWVRAALEAGRTGRAALRVDRGEH